METPPAAARVRTYPAICRNRWVFVWMGEAGRADPAMLPDNFSCGEAGWHYKPGYMHYDTPYLLICDNLLDFSHLSWVHEKTLGGSTAIALARPTLAPVDAAGQRGVKVSRQVPGVPPPPYYAKIRAMPPAIDRWFVYDFLLPGTLLMHSGGRPTGDAPDNMQNAVQLHSCQTLTPETAGSTHYFFMQAYRAQTEQPVVTEGIFQSLVQAFMEDRDMISAQHRTIQSAPGAPMLPLYMDAALVQFRRLLEREHALEAGLRPAAA